ncbi:MAG TPA: hypothetical protein VNT81_18810 [Vicinamibacterales bacterium]|nr:hypothetical protein [Vicinamibacterales bacterium]
MKRLLIAGIALVLVAPAASKVDAQSNTMTFFITSAGPGKGGDLGGIAGADAHCAALAKAAGAPANRVWRAYLSTDKEHAKDRIGAGPWTNAKGVQVAASVADLHSDNNKLSKDNSLTEKGAVVNGRGDKPNQHDILTGSNLDGTSSGKTCNNWTSSGADFTATVGHHDRQGGGANPTSWHSAHDSKGCGLDALRGSGGEGYFYCFAAK